MYSFPKLIHTCCTCINLHSYVVYINPSITVFQDLHWTTRVHTPNLLCSLQAVVCCAENTAGHRQFLRTEADV